jgi:hypothetical protein
MAASPIDKLYAEARKKAANTIGGEAAFRLQGWTIRRALVSAEILYIVITLGRRGTAAEMQQLTEDLYDKLTDDEEMV